MITGQCQWGVSKMTQALNRMNVIWGMKDVMMIPKRQNGSLNFQIGGDTKKKTYIIFSSVYETLWYVPNYWLNKSVTLSNCGLK